MRTVRDGVPFIIYMMSENEKSIEKLPYAVRCKAIGQPCVIAKSVHLWPRDGGIFLKRRAIDPLGSVLDPNCGL